MASDVRTTTAVVAQASRDGARQARLALLLRGVEELELTRLALDRSVNCFARARTSDVVDASIVEIARDGDEILTSDPDDLVPLARAARRSS